ncbi:MAG TPA: HD domain-containing protein [Gaiellaceae bacterium]|nr:HD domain-containing protein [Gaiellaceae bacterium]
MLREIEDYVRGLGLDAYLVGGAVRDELLGLDSKDADFLVPGVDTDALRAALAPHGRVEDLVVAERLVGVRLHPSDKAVRALAPVGIEFAPPRREVSTGPGRHDFEIVADASLSVEDDMRRRDFTVNAMARRLSDGAIVDPLDGRADLERRILRAVSDTSFAEDPLRLVRGLRFVSQLGFELEPGTLEHMKAEARAVELVSGERIAEELSKLLLGARPRDALVVARDTGVLVELIPEFGGLARDLSDHIFAVVQESADAGDDLAVRLATLFHDVGKPIDPSPLGHAQVAAEIAHATLVRLRFPVRLTRRVVDIVREHPYRDEDRPRTPRAARRLLLEHGDELTFDLVAHRLADLRAKDRDTSGLEESAALLEQELSSPHHLRNLAVDGDDLISLGLSPGPEIGRTLRELLEYVVDHPEANTRDELLARVRR